MGSVSTPGVLCALAVLLAGPVPAGLARLPRLRRTPVAAMVLWQAVALAAVLAALGAGVTLAAPGELVLTRDVVTLAALAVTVLVLGRLLLSGHRVGTALRRARSEHREQVDLLGRREAGDLRVLAHDVPLAYCVPAARGGARVVVTEGALSRLDEGEVRAVLGHERAHLRARHDLVLEFFDVLHRAFPRVVQSRAALAEVRLLAEVLADRSAARDAGAPAVARALVAVAAGRAPAAAMGAGGPDLLERVRLLGDVRPRPAQAAATVALAVAVVVLPTVLVVWPWAVSFA
ncbi:MAG: Zn-dependent protease with chaperone function [Nocardioides sp.]|nr:Zn-dependent protease with chaperone function [Nocardioides sp.]